MPLVRRRIRLSVVPAGAAPLVPKAFVEGATLTGVKG
jgi:hypothetical protein